MPLTETSGVIDALRAERDLVVGLEHEYQVFNDEVVTDFRNIIHRLDLDGRRIDPCDPDAYRCRWGGLVTADGAEAEVAIAPTTIGTGFSQLLHDRAVAARLVLAAQLPAQVRLEGYSTHLSVEVPDAVVARTAVLFARHFSFAMMLMVDRQRSPGLLVRPRPNRLELAGEYSTGFQLRAASTFATAAGLRCVRAAHSRRVAAGLPRLPNMRLVPALGRQGWYIDRCAFGIDLYRHGRDATLHCGRRPTRAGDLLSASWADCRNELEGLIGQRDLEIVDAVVDGRLALPSESVAPDDICSSSDRDMASPFGTSVEPRSRRGFEIKAIAVSWSAVVFRIEKGSQSRVACIPRHFLASFIDALDHGHLDDAFIEILSSAPRGEPLRSAEQTDKPGVFDELTDAGAIVPDEPAVGRFAGRFSGGRSGRQARTRKHQPRGKPRHLLLIAVAAVLTVALAATVALTRGGTAGPAPFAAQDFLGTYAVTATVTVSNANLPVGTVSHFEITIEGDCASGADRCILRSKNFTNVEASATSIKLVGTGTEPCTTDPTITITDDFDIELHPTQFDTTTGRHIPTRLEGTEHLSSRVATCPNVTNMPITDSLVADRKT